MDDLELPTYLHRGGLKSHLTSAYANGHDASYRLDPASANLTSNTISVAINTSYATSTSAR